MKSNLVLIPKLIVNPSNMVFYNEVRWDPFRPSRQKINIFKDVDIETDSKFLKSARKSEGNVSINAKRKLSKAIDYLITTSHDQTVYERISGKNVIFKIAFITLTLPSKQIHSDKEIIEKCLNSFLIEIKKAYHVANYVWRAEKQKNGNVHFHLLINKFISWSELRDRWNRITNKLGYVDRYRDFLIEWHQAGFKVRTDLLKNWDLQAQRLAFQKGKTNDFRSPNSTDIHGTKKIKNIIKYVTKYLTKNEKTENSTQPSESEFDNSTGRIWGCNRELSNITGYQCEIDTETADQIDRVIKSGACRTYKSTYFTVFTIEWHDLAKHGAEHLFKYFSDYLFDKFGYSEQLSIV